MKNLTNQIEKQPVVNMIISSLKEELAAVGQSLESIRKEFPNISIDIISKEVHLATEDDTDRDLYAAMQATAKHLKKFDRTFQLYETRFEANYDTTPRSYAFVADLTKFESRYVSRHVQF